MRCATRNRAYSVFLLILATCGIPLTYTETVAGCSPFRKHFPSAEARLCRICGTAALTLWKARSERTRQRASRTTAVSPVVSLETSRLARMLADEPLIIVKRHQTLAPVEPLGWP